MYTIVQYYEDLFMEMFVTITLNNGLINNKAAVFLSQAVD